MFRRSPMTLLGSLLLAGGCATAPLTLAGCATTPPPLADEGPRVPVYQRGDKMPCDYEVMGRIRAERKRGVRSEREYRLDMEQSLGRAGAEAGADAVIVEDFRMRLPLVVVQPGQPRPSPIQSPPRPYEGDAIRWIPETCKGPLGHPSGGA